MLCVYFRIRDNINKIEIKYFINILNSELYKPIYIHRSGFVDIFCNLHTLLLFVSAVTLVSFACRYSNEADGNEGCLTLLIYNTIITNIRRLFFTDSKFVRLLSSHDSNILFREYTYTFDLICILYSC